MPMSMAAGYTSQAPSTPNEFTTSLGLVNRWSERRASVLALSAHEKQPSIEHRDRQEVHHCQVRAEHRQEEEEPAEALDWMHTRAPREWRFGGETRTYHWMPDIGCPPPGLLGGDAARLVYGCTGLPGQAASNGCP